MSRSFYRMTIALTTMLTWIATLAQPARPEMTLIVDAREAPRRLLHVRESFPVHEGPLTLYYPKWIPGEHAPTGPISDVVGVQITANAQAVSWRRDLDDMYALHCEVPPQTNMLDVTFDFILPAAAQGFSSGASSSAQLCIVSWNQVVLYPKSISSDILTVTPRLFLPEGWRYGTALETEGESGGEIRFMPVSLTNLIDSPVLAGRFFKRIDISAGTGTSHFLDMAAEGEAALQISDAQQEMFRRLVREANALFGARHYNHYNFLLTLSDNTAHFGLEHHQSSDNRVRERTLLNEDLFLTSAGLLPHEFVHSWNGKHRRPAGLATGDFSTPMHDDLLWVYEGLTQYLGNVLTGRSGLRSPELWREHLALSAAALDHRPGREWRPLQETADAAPILYGSRPDWDSYRRGVDFYDEGNLLWLEVDAIIRQESKGAKSLDDFCKLFHGGENSGPAVKPYTFDDVVATLGKVVRYDWGAHLTERLRALSPHAPLGGIERCGWKVVYRDTMSRMMKAYEEREKRIDMRFSLGITLDDEGKLVDVIPGMPAAKSGLAPGMRIVAVNGKRYSKECLRDAVRAAKSHTMPLELLAENAEYFATYKVDYHGGERYPFLERDASKPDLLSKIITPTVKK